MEINKSPNFCPSCGLKITTQDAKFCGGCGGELPVDVPELIASPAASGSDEPTGTHVNHEPISTKRSGPNKMMIGLAVVLGSIVLIAGTVFGINTYLDSNPKKLYLLAEAKTYQKNKAESAISYFDKELALFDMFQDRPATMNTELTADFKLNDGDSYDDLMQEIIRDSKVSLTSLRHPTQKASHNTFSYHLRDEKKLEAVFVNDEDNIGIELPGLYHRMFYLNQRDFGDLMTSFDPYYSGPEEWPFKFEQFQAENEELRQQVIKKYTDFLIEQLEEEYFTLTNNVEHKIAGETLRVKQIDITLSESELKQLLTDLIDEIRLDDELYDLLVAELLSFVEMLGSIYGNRSIYYEPLDRSDIDELFKDEFKDALYEARMAIRDLSLPRGLQMTVFIDKNKHIVERRLRVDFKEPNSSTRLTLNVDMTDSQTAKDTQTKTFNATMSSSPEADVSITFATKTTVKQTDSGENKDLSLSFLVEEDREKLYEIIFDLNSSVNHLSSNETESVHNVSLNFGDFYERYIISGTLTRTIDQNLKDDYSNQHYGVDLQVKMFDYYYDTRDSFQLKLNINNEVTFDDKLDVPGIKDNALNVLNLNDDDWYDIENEIFMELEYQLLDELERLYDFW